MKGYQVWFKDLSGQWVIDEAADGVNLIYAQIVAEYHQDRGRSTRIINLDEQKG